MLIKIGKGIELDVNFDKMPANAIEHFLKIGARNVFMDSHASVTKEKYPDNFVALSRAAAEKKLESMLRGNVRVAITGTRAVDLYTKELRIVAMNKVLARGLKPKDATFKSAVEKEMTNPKTMERAKQRADELAADMAADATDVEI